MAFAFGTDSLRELEGVHPRLADVFKRAIRLSAVDFSMHDGLRTMEEQRRYVQTGVSQTMESKHRKQADGWGHAGDAVPFINGKLRWEWPPIYRIAVAVAQALIDHNKANPDKPPLRIRWGGCWQDISTIPATAEGMEKAVADYGARKRAAGKKAFTDGPHFEILSA